jgi:hypothetical protein
LAVTDAFPWMVNVQVFALLPPLGQVPDQIASRPLVTLSVIDVPVLNVAEPVLPTATLIPAGLELTRSPFRPVAVTESVAVWTGGDPSSFLRVSTLVVGCARARGDGAKAAAAEVAGALGIARGDRPGAGQ